MKIIKRYGVGFFMTGAFLLNLALTGEQVAFSQEQEGVVSRELAAETSIEPIMIKVRKAKSRTPEDMDAMEAVLSPSYGEAEKPFMPIMDPSEYAALKAAAETSSSGESRPSMPESLAPEPFAPPLLKGVSVEGANQTSAGGSFPPDTHGAVGHTHYVQAVNTRIFRYNKAGALLSSLSLQSLFGSTEFIFDPRVVYDQTWQRWVIVASRRSTSSTDTVRRFFLAISKTSNPTGAYWVYPMSFSGGIFNNGDWWDYPQLGMDQDAVFVTGNIFDTPTGGFKGAAMMSFAKARIYNGLGTTVPVFTGLDGSICPPIVLDQNKNAYFIANYAGTHVSLWRGENLSNAFQATLVLQTDINVDDYTIPPPAPQLGTTQKLDTLDTRFVNASTQYADSLWNVHSINSGGFATPRFYQIDTEGAGINTIKQQGYFFESGPSSHDFNASIAANTSGEAFVVWSTTDTTNANAGLRHNARIRFSGRQPADLLGTIPAGSILFTSGVALTGNTSSTPGVQRWGDYSAVSLDPNSASGANRQAWITNEKVNAASVWGSRIARIGY